MRMAHEECFSFLVVFMLGQLGAGIQRAALPGWAVTSRLSMGTQDPVLSPPDCICKCSKPCKRQSSAQLPRRAVSPINAKGFSYKEATGVKELTHSYPTLSCPST